MDKMANMPNARKKPFILVHQDETLCGQQIYGTCVTVPLTDLANDRYVYKETLQCIPWSSGPMYFTNISFIVVKRCGQILKMGNLFEWVNNPDVKDKEYDPVLGHYWL